MKKLTALMLAAMLALSLCALALAEPVTLTMGSWRNDDAELVQRMLDKYAEKSGVKIKYEPTQSAQYNATLRLQLDNGTGPDLFYSRSYATGRELYNAGFNLDVTDLKGVKENFTPASLEPWTAQDGKVFAVPVAAVSQVVYYNTKLFADNKLTVPETFEDFLALCQKIKDLGVSPLANGIASEWDILECVYNGMLPNYIGGADARAKYESGEAKMNDAAFVKSLEDFAALSKFFPEGFQSVKNDDGPLMMANGQAAMFIDGSWTSGAFARNYDFKDVGVFAMPAPKGNKPGLCFHPDYAIAGNKATKHPEEVKAFLEWVASPEGAQILADDLAEGFFPMINAPITMKNELANSILKLNEGRVLDARFTWPKFDTLYNPMRIDLDSIAKGEKTPKEVADHWAQLQEEALAVKK